MLNEINHTQKLCQVLKIYNSILSLQLHAVITVITQFTDKETEAQKVSNTYCSLVFHHDMCMVLPEAPVWQLWQCC